jgi:hypothetical protein
MLTVRPLAPPEIEALVTRHHVGRLAYSFHDDVDIAPVHYVYADRVLYVRTAPGHEITTLAHHRWVAFEVDEVDEVDGRFDWRSVVVRGSVSLVTPGPTPRDRATYAHTVARLRELAPAVFTEDDSTLERTALFRLHVDRMTGRVATTEAR